MPQGTKVANCVRDVEAQGKSKGHAIPICQASTGQSYQSGKPIKKAKGGTECWNCGEPSEGNKYCENCREGLGERDHEPHPSIKPDHIVDNPVRKALFDDPEDPTFKDPSARGKGPIPAHRILDSLNAGQSFGFNDKGKYEGPKEGITKATLVKPGRRSLTGALAGAPPVAKPSGGSPAAPSSKPAVGGSAPIAKPFAPPSGLSPAAGASAQVAATQRYGDQKHIKAPTAQLSPPMATPIKKEASVSNRAKALMAVAQRRMASKKIQESRGPCPDVPPLGHYEGGEETKPIQKAIDEDREDEEVIKMGEGFKLNIGRGMAKDIGQKPAAGSAAPKVQAPNVEQELGAKAHLEGKLPNSDLSTAKYLQPNTKLPASRPGGLRTELRGRLAEAKAKPPIQKEAGCCSNRAKGKVGVAQHRLNQPVQEARLDHPFAGKPSARRSKKGVER